VLDAGVDANRPRAGRQGLVEEFCAVNGSRFWRICPGLDSGARSLQQSPQYQAQSQQRQEVQARECPTSKSGASPPPPPGAIKKVAE